MKFLSIHNVRDVARDIRSVDGNKIEKITVFDDKGMSIEITLFHEKIKEETV